MGFIESHPATLIRPLTAGDYIQLAALGAAARRPITPDDVIQAVDTLAGPLWSPTSELVGGVVESLVADSCLTLLPGGRLDLSTTGRRRLHDLLAQPVQSPLAAFGQVGVRLKLAFMDLLPSLVRRRQINGIITAYECEIAARSARCTAWPLNGDLGRLWLDHQMDELEDGLGLLRSLAEC